MTTGARFSRRSMFAGGGLLMLSTACGTSEQQGGAGANTVAVRHRYGTADVPVKPKRVVTVGLTEQDYVIAFGTTPVAAREWFGGHPGALWPWARAKIGDDAVPEVLTRQALDFERIASLRPDAILGMNSGITKKDYTTLSGIAPTVAQPVDVADYGASWKGMTRTVGEIFGATGKADKLVADIDGRLSAARKQHPRFADATGLLATSIDGTAWVYATGPAPRLLRTLGFKMPDDAAALFTDKQRKPVKLSLEKLKLLEADVLLVGIYGDKSASVVREPLYQQLDVAQQGRDVLMPKQSTINGAVSFSSVLSLPVALDGLVPRLAAAIDGDPATAVNPIG